jgi:hypothetical protein
VASNAERHVAILKSSDPRKKPSSPKHASNTNEVFLCATAAIEEGNTPK